MPEYSQHLYVTAQMLGHTPWEPTNPPGINSGHPDFRAVAKDVTDVSTATNNTATIYRLSGWQLNGNTQFANGQWWDLYAYTGTAADPSLDTNPDSWKLVYPSMTPKPDLVQNHGITADYVMFNTNAAGAHLILQLDGPFTSTPSPWQSLVPPGVITFPEVQDIYQSDVLCFLEGTMIETLHGEKAIETLNIGDKIQTIDGKEAAILWIGKKSIARSQLRAKDLPVRIEANAFGPALPHSDLYVTADHGMVLGGYVINAGALVNETSIARTRFSDMAEVVNYYHIETTNHEIIIANGAPSETYIDYVSRRAFDNYDEYSANCGFERIIPEMPYMRISSQRLVPASIKAMLGLEQSDADLIAEEIYKIA